MSKHFDKLETRSTEEREFALFSKLPDFLHDSCSRIPAWKERLTGIDISGLTSRDAISKIPVLRKEELMNAQSANPPFGGFVDEKLVEGSRVFMSPGPVWEPQPPGPDPWLVARAAFAAGIRPSDLVHVGLSYHMTPGGFIMDEGMRSLGAKVYPGGTGNTEMQVEAASILKPTAFAGTPDFLKIMLGKAKEMKKDLSSFSKALVSGGALFPSLRDEYASQGVNVLQAYATADLGVIAYESMVDDAPCEGMMCSEELIVEIVRPGTDEPVPDGEVGELVVTNFNTAYPLIRFGTGDLSAVLAEPSPCGRTNMRIKGWMGRADQRTKVKGMFVDPKQIDQLVKSIDGIERARLVVTRENDQDVMTLQVQGSAQADQVAGELSTITKLKGTVEFVDSLPNDGKIIDDQRDYSS